MLVEFIVENQMHSAIWITGTVDRVAGVLLEVVGLCFCRISDEFGCELFETIP